MGGACPGQKAPLMGASLLNDMLYRLWYAEKERKRQ